MRKILAISLIGMLGGCATMPDEIKLDSTVYSAQNAGLVVGAMADSGPYGTWIEFLNLDTGKSFGWGVQDYYSAWLPPGSYEVHSMGSRRGVMGPYSRPLRFSVKPGVINYLGEMTYGCSARAQPEALYGVKSCGFLALFTCSVPSPTVGLCVEDRQEQGVRNFLKKNPEYATLPVRSSVMVQQAPD